MSSSLTCGGTGESLRANPSRRTNADVYIYELKIDETVEDRILELQEKKYKDQLGMHELPELFKQRIQTRWTFLQHKYGPRLLREVYFFASPIYSRASESAWS
ncbi:hypothetical protein B0H19DRAFT_1231702 [Mycena capillaripes]|nr:hypothetical protein B0H19DRAFT_1231702 [Mycena capillaripes]